MSLIDKLRAARLSQVDADGHLYTIRRPTDAEAVSLAQSAGLDLVRQFVADWDHTELSLGIPGGSAVAVPFDAELWREWVADQPQVWGILAEAIIAAYSSHAEKRETDAKN